MNHNSSSKKNFFSLFPILGFFCTAGFLMAFFLAMGHTGKRFNIFLKKLVNQDVLDYLIIHRGNHPNWLISNWFYLGLAALGFGLVALIWHFFFRQNNLSKIYGLVLSVLLLTGLDLYSKLWAFLHYGDGHPHALLGKWIYLTYAQNTGMAWSLLEGKTGFLSLMSLVAIPVILYFFWSGWNSKLMLTSLVLILAGALGNLHDRLWYQYVRDFIDLRRWPIFNLADCYIVVGTVLLLIASSIEKKEEKKPEEKGQEEKNLGDESKLN